MVHFQRYFKFLQKKRLENPFGKKGFRSSTQRNFFKSFSAFHLISRKFNYIITLMPFQAEIHRPILKILFYFSLFFDPFRISQKPTWLVS